MVCNQDRLTLDSLLADPLTRLVMHSDNITPAQVAAAFEIARTGLVDTIPEHDSLASCCFSVDPRRAGLGLPWIS